MSKRLPNVAGEWIDRNQPIEFSFEGQRYSGFAGDTLSSALHASGVRALGRSFKYHRLRGILSMANHDVNTMMQIGDRLNLRADVTPLESDMKAIAINTRGVVTRLFSDFASKPRCDNTMRSPRAAVDRITWHGPR